MEYSNQYKKAFINEPAGKLFPHERDGRMRRLYCDITLVGDITAANPILLQKLPKGAVISKAKIVGEAGTAGTLNLGWSEGLNEIASVDGLFAGLASNAAISEEANIAGSAVGINKRFAGEVNLILSASVDSTGLAGKIFKLELEYVID